MIKNIPISYDAINDDYDDDLKFYLGFLYLFKYKKKIYFPDKT